MKSTAMNLALVFGLSFFVVSNGQANSKLTGTVKIDGSSTVFPITEAMAEEFQKLHPGVRVTVGLSGTGGGMKKFTVGDVDITGASRPIVESERNLSKSNNISFVELPVANDGIAVVVHAKNPFVQDLTVEELKRLWQPGSSIHKWSDLRKDWPSKKISLYGPGADSGTFEYFTHAIVGKAKSTRPDFTASEDDNVLVQGVAGDLYALGYFGFAYWMENQTRVKRVAINPGKGPILPSHETIKNGTYRPLSRPMFIYVNLTSLNRPEVDAFVKFYLEQSYTLAAEVGYVPFEKPVYTALLTRLKKRMPGTVFGTELADKETSLLDLVSMKGQ